MDRSDAGEMTVRQVWEWLAWEWDLYGWGSAAVRWTTVTVVTVMFVLGVGAAVMLRSLARRVSERAEAREVEPAAGSVRFTSGRVGVGPVTPQGRVYAPGSGDQTVVLDIAAPNGRASSRWDPDRTIEWRIDEG